MQNPKHTHAVGLLQEEHHPLLRPFQPTLSLSGAASLARVDSSFGMRALEKLNPQGMCLLKAADAPADTWRLYR